METGKLTAHPRTETGKSAITKLRQKGLIPAVVYGNGAEPSLVQLSSRDLVKALDPIKGKNTLLHLSVEGQSGSIPVMLKDTQRDVLRGDIIHADLLRVSTDKPVRAMVALVTTGKAAGVTLGGSLHQVYRQVPVSCVPGKIPSKIEVDVTSLGLNQALHVSDVKMPEGVTLALQPTTTLVTLAMIREEKAEGAAAAAPGAAPSATTPAAKAEAGKAEGKPAAKAAAAGAKGDKPAKPAAAKK
jgi:large subunit ribosomal protein L25